MITLEIKGRHELTRKGLGSVGVKTTWLIELAAGDFSYSLKSLFKSVYQTGNRDTNGLINSTIPFATSI